MSEAEVDARQEILLENYASVIEIEAGCLLEMVKTGVEPATAQDLALYAHAKESRRYVSRLAAYDAVTEGGEALAAAIAATPSGEPAEVAAYCRDVLKPLLGSVREACDAAEGMVKKELWPFPSYTDVCYGHHSNAPKK